MDRVLDEFRDSGNSGHREAESWHGVRGAAFEVHFADLDRRGARRDSTGPR